MDRFEQVKAKWTELAKVDPGDWADELGSAEACGPGRFLVLQNDYAGPGPCGVDLTCLSGFEDAMDAFAYLRYFWLPDLVAVWAGTNGISAVDERAALDEIDSERAGVVRSAYTVLEGFLAAGEISDEAVRDAREAFNQAMDGKFPCRTVLAMGGLREIVSAEDFRSVADQAIEDAESDEQSSDDLKRIVAALDGGEGIDWNSDWVAATVHETLSGLCC